MPNDSRQKLPGHGVYNVHPEEYDPTGFQYKYLHSETGIPQTTRDQLQAEAKAIQNLTNSVVQAHLEATEFPRIDALIRDLYFETQAHDFYGDRSQWLHLPLAEILTAQMVEAIQVQVLHLHPLWRIVVVHPLHSDVVFLYPWGLCSDAGPKCTTGDAALVAWQEVSQTVEDHEWGCTREQLPHVREQIRKISQKRNISPVLIVSTYKRYKRHSRMRAVWAMTSKAPSELRAYFQDEVCGCPFVRKVNKSGEVFPLNRQGSAFRWLVLWTAPVREHDCIVVKTLDKREERVRVDEVIGDGITN